MDACLSDREMKLVGLCWPLDERWLVNEILTDGTEILTSSEFRMAVNLLRACSLAGSCRTRSNSEAVLPSAPSYSIASISFTLTGDTTTLPGSWADRYWWQSKLHLVRNWILVRIGGVQLTLFPCSVLKTLFASLFLARQPPVGQGLLIHEVSRSHTTTHHSP